DAFGSMRSLGKRERIDTSAASISGSDERIRRIGKYSEHRILRTAERNRHIYVHVQRTGNVEMPVSDSVKDMGKIRLVSKIRWRSHFRNIVDSGKQGKRGNHGVLVNRRSECGRHMSGNENIFLAIG